MRTGRRATAILAVLVMLLGTVAAAPLSVRAATTVTNGNDSGAGSLRQAILDAAADDTITFAVGVTTVTLTSGALTLTKNVTITGPGATALTVNRDGAAPRFGMFIVNVDVTAAISGLTISGGFTRDGGLGVGLGGGGIRNNGTLTLTEVVVSGNRTGDGGTYTSEGGFGGGISNSSNSTLTLIRSTVSGNRTGNGGTNTSGMRTGVSTAGFGGGINNQGILVLTDSTVSGNSTGNGGIGPVGAGNGANGGFGGGIRNTGTLTATNSTVSGNSTGNGGTRNGSGTGGSGGSGGGITNELGTISLTNITVSGNTTGTGGNGAGGDGGGIINYVDTSTFTMSGVILSGNSASGSGPDLRVISGTITDNGYNLIGATSGYTFAAMNGNVFSTNPGLAPLAHNGGPTQTLLPLRDGPARNTGDPAGCGPTDQRGVARPQEGRCDIGAAEFVLTPLTLGAARAGAAGSQTVTLIGTGFYDGTTVFVNGESAPVLRVSPDGTQLTFRLMGRPAGTSVSIVAVNLNPTQAYSNTLTFVLPDAAPTPTRPTALLNPTPPAAVAPTRAVATTVVPMGAMPTPTPLPAPTRR